MSHFGSIVYFLRYDMVTVRRAPINTSASVKGADLAAAIGTGELHTKLLWSYKTEINKFRIGPTSSIERLVGD